MRTRLMLEAADAATILMAAKAEARKQGWKIAVAVLDEAGNLLALERMDGTPAGASGVATEKGRTAALFRLSTKVLQDLVKDQPHILELPACPVQGGVPIMVGNECVGGVGVGGMDSPEDEHVALAGVAALKA